MSAETPAEPRTVLVNGKEVELPKSVTEQPTNKTSIYNQGKLVYDGATGQPPPDVAAGLAPGASMNELLQWGLANSDPQELQRRKEAGETVKPMDKEIVDMLLGEPTVAKMRTCLAKLSEEALATDDGAAAGEDALAELEFYVEDLDNANDLAKIGGVQTLLSCFGAPSAEVREGACAVLAACLQNNPKFQEASLALSVPEALLQLLRASAEAAAAADALAVSRKALYALSALLRSSAEAMAHVLELPGAMGTLVAQCAVDDLKSRRRATFLLMALARDLALPPAAFAAQPEAPAVLLRAATDADEDVRSAGLQLLLALRASHELCDALVALGATEQLAAARAEAQRLAEAGEGDPQHPQQLDQLLAWVKR